MDCIVHGIYKKPDLQLATFTDRVQNPGQGQACFMGV